MRFSDLITDLLGLEEEGPRQVNFAGFCKDPSMQDYQSLGGQDAGEATHSN